MARVALGRAARASNEQEQPFALSDRYIGGFTDSGLGPTQGGTRVATRSAPSPCSTVPVLATFALIVWTLGGAGIGMAVARASGRSAQAADVLGVMALGAVLGVSLGWMLLEPAQAVALADRVVAQAWRLPE
jgi:hypothetical protein